MCYRFSPIQALWTLERGALNPTNWKGSKLTGYCIWAGLSSYSVCNGGSVLKAWPNVFHFRVQLDLIQWLPFNWTQNYSWHLSFAELWMFFCSFSCRGEDEDLRSRCSAVSAWSLPRSFSPWNQFLISANMQMASSRVNRIHRAQSLMYARCNSVEDCKCFDFNLLFKVQEGSKFRDSAARHFLSFHQLTFTALLYLALLHLSSLCTFQPSTATICVSQCAGGYFFTVIECHWMAATND